MSEHFRKPRVRRESRDFVMSKEPGSIESETHCDAMSFPMSLVTEKSFSLGQDFSLRSRTDRKESGRSDGHVIECVGNSETPYISICSYLAL